MNAKSDRNIDIVAIGRKGRDFLRRSFPTAEAGAERKGPIQIVAEHVGILGKADFEFAGELAQNVIDRYCEGQIDAVYLVFNEFKSVIAQRLVVDKVLPIAKNWRARNGTSRRTDDRAA